MSKPVVIVGILLAFVSVSIGILLFLSYGVETRPPTRHKISGLEKAVSIRWAEEGPIHIQTAERRDYYTALGYAHGMNRSWVHLGNAG